MGGDTNPDPSIDYCYGNDVGLCLIGWWEVEASVTGYESNETYYDVEGSGAASACYGVWIESYTQVVANHGSYAYTEVKVKFGSLWNSWTTVQHTQTYTAFD
ncbi:hypothetical protein JW865_00660 [Candidatus Bathyarchaeota archaeon]|nr:hypothetical protein [Candidatus Bathyarchaeota archaeon]